MLPEPTALDWMFLLVLLASMVVGAWRGLVYEVILALGWVAAFVCAQWWADPVAQRLPTMNHASPSLRYAVAFAVLFIGAIFVAGLVAWAVKKIVAAVGLRPVDRILGAVFGVARAVLALLALTVVINMTTVHKHPWWQQSRGAAWLSSALSVLKPMMPSSFERYLASALDTA